jgi:hypothetical protein
MGFPTRSEKRSAEMEQNDRMTLDLVNYEVKAREAI